MAAGVWASCVGEAFLVGGTCRRSPCSHYYTRVNTPTGHPPLRGWVTSGAPRCRYAQRLKGRCSHLDDESRSPERDGAPVSPYPPTGKVCFLLDSPARYGTYKKAPNRAPALSHFPKPS